MGNDQSKKSVSKNDRNDKNAIERDDHSPGPEGPMISGVCNIPDQDLGLIIIKGDKICEIYRRYNA